MNKEFLKYYLIIIFALILGISADFLFYQKSIGVSFFIFVSIFLIFSLILSKIFKEKLSKVQYVLLIPIILFSAMVFLRASEFLVFFNILSSLFLISLFLILFSKRNLSSFTFAEYFVSPFSFLLKSFRKSAVFIEECRNKIQTEKKLGSPKFRSVIKGVILSSPILIIFLLLFYSADIIFQKHLDKLLEKISFINIDVEIIIRALVILIASYLFIGIFAKSFYAVKSNEKSEKLSTENNQVKFLGSIESSIVLGAVELLFLIFIIIQFLYLFGGKAYVWGIPEYITYSEYARKGFGELIAVSIISFLLIYGIDRFGKRENLKQNKIFKILSGILVCEIFVIIASAITRLLLYADGYGYTFSRLFGFIFLYWLCFIFLLFLYKIFKEKKESAFLFSVFWLIILFWGGINFLNPDAYIAQKNIERYIDIEEKEFDAWHLSRLSEDAVPEIVKIFKINKGDEKEKIEIARELNRRYKIYPYNFLYDDFYPGRPEKPINAVSIQEKESKKIEKWQSFNLSKKKASASLEENSDEIKKYLILFWDKEIDECWKRFDECNENKSSDCEQNIKPQAENLSHFPLLQKPTTNKEKVCNWIKAECERYQEKKQKLKEFK